MRIKKMIYVVLFFILSVQVFAGYIYRTNGKLVFFETFSGKESMDDTYPDQNNRSTVSGGQLYNGGTAFGGWDGPSWDIQYFEKSQRVYVAIDAVKADCRDDGTYYGYGVYLGKFDLNGTESWSSLVWVQRRTNASDINNYASYDPSSYPSLTLDTNENIYVVWKSKIANGNQYIWVQKFTNASAPAPAWNNGIEVRAFSNVNYYNCNPRIDYYKGYIYIVGGDGSSVRIQKINSTNGQRMWGVDGITIASTSVYYPPDIKVGPDGILYIVYYHTGDDNIYLQKRSVNDGSQIDSTFRVNETSGRYSDTGGYWYWSERNCAIDIDASTNIFIAWSLRYNGHKVWAQELQKNGVSFNRIWTNSGNDYHVGVVDDQSASYVDIEATDSEFVYVSWDSHNSDRNNHGMLQQIRKSTKEQFDNDIDLNQNYSFYHNGRIAVQGNNCLTYGHYFRFQKFNQAGSRSFNYWNRPYFQSGASSYRAYRNVGRYLSVNIIPGVVKKVRLYDVSTYNPSWGKIRWTFSGQGWDSANYNSNTNWLDENDIGSSTTFETNYTIPTSLQGNNLEMQILMYAKTRTRENDGKDTPRIYEYKVEAVESYLGDLEVGTYENGQNTYGNLVINSNGDNQNMIIFVYPDGVNSAEGFFFFKNEGNVKTNFLFKGLGSTANWTVKYYDCIWNGTNWLTNSDITASITGSGWQQSVEGYTNENQMRAIKLKATAANGLADGTFYQVYLTNFAQAGGTWYKHDVAFLRAQATKYLPDIEIGTILSNGSVIDYQGRGIYNSDATFQEQFLKADTNVVASYYIRIKNVGDNDTFQISGYPSATNFSVAYYDSLQGGSLLPSSITQSYWSLHLNNNQSTQIRVDVTPHDTTAFGNEYDVFVGVISSNNIIQEDRVKATTRVINSKADILVRTESGTFIGDNIYNTNANNQIVSNQADNGMTNVFVYRVQNQGTETMDMILRSIKTTGLTSGWNVQYFDGSVNVTSQITDSLFGYTINNLNVGASHDITVTIAPPSTLNTGANELMAVKILTKPEGAPTKDFKWDAGLLQTRCVSSKLDLIAISTNEVGRTIINTNSINQTTFQYINHKMTNQYWAVISNSADSAYSVKVYKNEMNILDWNVHYYYGASDITSSLSSGWTSPILPAHSTITLMLQVHPTTNVVSDVTNGIFIKGVSLINTNEDIDVVKYETSRVFPPDFLLKTTNDMAYFGNGLYGTNIPEQTSGGSYSTNIVIQGNTNDYLYIVKLQNDRKLSDSFKLTAQSFDFTDAGVTNGTNYWHVGFFQYIGNNPSNPEYNDNSKWSDITTDITSVNGYALSNISGGSNIIFKIGVRVTNTNINEGFYNSVEMFVESLNTTFYDKIRAITTYGIARPDLIVQPSWDNIYESSNNVVQIVTNIIDKSAGSSFDFVVENNSPINIGNFYIKGQKSTNDWNIRYYDLSANTNDVTASVGSSSGYFKILNPQTSMTMRCVTTIATESAYPNGETLSEWVQVEPKDGNLIDRGLFVSIITDYGKPDLSTTNNAWTNIFETSISTISQQQSTNLIEKGHSVDIPFLIYNQKQTTPEMVRFHGDGDTGDYTVKYWWWHNSAWSNVTAQATGVGNEFKSLINNMSCITMKAEIHLDVNSGYNFGDMEDFIVYAKSQGQQKIDYAKFWMSVADLGNPDIVLTNMASSTQIWDNVKETTPVVQKQTVFLEKGYTNTIFLKLQNDKVEGENLKFSASAGNWIDDFYADYFIITNNTTNNITATAVSSYYTNYVGTSSNILAMLKFTLKSNSTYTFSSNKIITFKLYSEEMNVFDSCSFVLSVTDRGNPDIVADSFSWNDIYSTNYIVQSTNLFAEMNFDRTYQFYVQNDRTDFPERVNLKINKNNPPFFKTQFFIKNGAVWSNISDSVFSTGTRITLPPVSTATLMSSVYLTNNATWVVGDSPLTNWLRVYSQGSLISDTARFVYTIGDFSKPNITLTSGGWSVRENVPITQITNTFVEKGETKTLSFNLNNDRNTNDTFIFNGSTSGFVDFQIQYFIVTNNITNNITASATNITGYTLSLPANTNALLLSQIYLSSNSFYTFANSFNLDLQLYSLEKTTLDYVRVITAVTDRGQPDIAQLTNSSWNDTISTNYIAQSIIVDIEKNDTKTFYYVLQNDRNDIAENLNFKITGGVGDYTTTIYSYTGTLPSDITTSVTSSTGYNLTLAPTTSKTLALVTTLNSNSSLSIGDSSCSYIFDLLSQGKLIHDKARVVFHVVDNGQPDISLVDNRWTNVVETTPSIQVTNLYLEKGHSNVITLKLWNHKSTENEIEIVNKLYGNSDIYSGFSFKYEVNNIDITRGVVTNQNQHITISSNSNVLLRIVAFLDSSSGYSIGFQQNNTTILKSLGGTVQDSVKLVYNVSDFGHPNIVQTNNVDWTNITTIYGAQEKYLNINKGDTEYFYFYVRNDRSDYAENLELLSEQSGDDYNDFSVSYERLQSGSWNDVTGSLVSGLTNTLSPNSVMTMRMSISLDELSSYELGEQPVEYHLILNSGARLVSDKAKIVMNVVNTGAPDIDTISDAWEGQLGENSQISNFSLEQGDTNRVFLKLENDNTNRAFTYRLKDVDTGNYGLLYNVSYSIITNSITNDVSSIVKGSGFDVFIPAGTNIGLLTTINLKTNNFTIGQSAEVRLQLGTKDDYTKDNIKLIVSATDRGLPDIALDNKWTNQYASTYYEEVTNVPIEKNETVRLRYYLENDRPDLSETMNCQLHLENFGDFIFTNYRVSGGSFTSVSTNFSLNLSNVSRATMELLVSLKSNSSLVVGNNDSDIKMNFISERGKQYDKAKFVFVVDDKSRPDIYLTNHSWYQVYEDSPSVQRQSIDIEKGITNVFDIKLGNSTNQNEIYNFKWTEDAISDFGFKFYTMTNGAIAEDITSSAFNQYTHISINSNTNILLHIVSILSQNSSHVLGVQKNVSLELLSLGETKRDKVKLIYNVSDFGQPNIVQTNNVNWTNITTIYGAQEKYLNINKGDTEYFYFYVRNDRSDYAENLELLAEQSGDDFNDFSVSYERLQSGSWNDVTGSLVSGLTNTLSPNSVMTMRMSISLDELSSYELGEQPVEYHLILNSGARLVSDKAKIVMNVVNTGAPDIDTISDAWEGQLGENSQISNFSLEQGDTNRVFLKLENDNTNRAFTYRLKDIDVGNYGLLYNVSYSIITNSVTNDVSSIVKGSGFDVSIPAGTNIGLLTTVNLKTNNFTIGQTAEVRLQLGTKDDYTKDNIKLIVSATDRGLPDITLDNKWTNQYASTYYEEVTNIKIEKNETVRLRYYLENDRPDLSETMNCQLHLENFGDFIFTNYRVSGGSFTSVSTNFSLNLSNVSRATMELLVSLKSNSSLVVGNNDSDIKMNFISERGKQYDKAKFVFVVDDKSRPDIYLTNQNWYQVYEDSPSVQRQSIDIEKGITNVFDIKLGNSTNRNEIYNFKWTEDAIGDFGFKFYTMTNGAIAEDITSSAFNQYAHISINSNTNILLRIVSILSQNSSHVLGVQKNVSLELLSLGETKRDKVKLIYNVADLGQPNIVQTNNVDWTNITENNALQNKTLTIEKGEQIFFPFLIRNDRNDYAENLQFSISESGDDVSAFTTVFQILNSGVWTNITSYTETFSIQSIRTMRMVTTLSKDFANFGTPDYNCVLTLESGARLVSDVAKLDFFITNTGKPDIALSQSEWQGYGDEFTQLTNISVEAGFSNMLITRLENDNTNKSFSYLLYEKDYQFHNGFHKYFYLTNNGWSSNVTTFVTNDGCVVQLSKNTNVYLKTIFYLDTSTYPLNTSFPTRLYFSTLDKDVTHSDGAHFNAVVADFGQPNIAFFGKWNNANVTNVLSGGQYTNINIEKGETITLNLIASNSRIDRTEKLLLQSYNQNALNDFHYTLSILSNSSYIDITGSITNSGYTNLRLSPQTKRTLQLQMSLATNSSYAIDQSVILSNYLKLYSQGRKRYDLGLFKFIVIDNNLPNIVKSDGLFSEREKTPIVQKTSFPIERGYSTTFDFILRNDRTNKQTSLWYKATHLTNQYNVTYLFKTNSGSFVNRTTDVTNSRGYLFDNTPSITNFLRIQIALPTNSTITNDVSLYTTLYSLGRDEYDRMEFTVKVTDRGRPDLLVETNFNNQYYPDDLQNYSFSMEKGVTITNFVYIQNDLTNVANRDKETYTVKADPSTNFWSIQYAIYTNGAWQDFNAVTNTNGRYLTVATQTIWTMRVVTTLQTNNIVQLNDMLTNHIWLISYAGKKMDEINLISIATDKGIPNITRLDGSWSEIEQSSAVSQLTNIFIQSNHDYTNYLIFNNQKNAAETMLIKGFQMGDAGWHLTIQSNNGNANLTSSIITNGFELTMPAHSSVTMQLKMMLATSTTDHIGFTNKVQIYFYSQGRLKKDSIQMNYIFRSPQPDIVINSTTLPSSPDGADIYGTNLNLIKDSSDLKVAQGRALVGPPSIFQLLLQNDDYYSDTIYLRRTNIAQQPGIWRFEIYDPDGNDITMSLTNYIAYSIDGRAYKEFTIKVFAYDNTPMTNYQKLKFFTYSKKNNTKKDVGGIVTTRVPVTVFGQVIAKYNSESLSGVKIEISDISNYAVVSPLTTDGNGNFTFDSLPGTYKILATKNGYIKYTNYITVPNQFTYTIDTISLIRYNLDASQFESHPFPTVLTSGDSLTIVFSLIESGKLSLVVYDSYGRLVNTLVDNENYDAGFHRIVWDGRDETGKFITRGVYFYILKFGDKKIVKKIFVK